MMISPPAGPLPGHCEAPAASHSYWQRARDVVTTLKRHYGTTRVILCLTLVIVLFSAAMIQLVDSARIIVKAHIAQMLIHHAWQENLIAGKPNIKPWPWADLSPVARMTFEGKDVEVFVLDNDAARTLAFGPGFHLRSTLPGRGGNAVISGHRDTHFSVLEKTEAGDLIGIQTIEGRQLLYQVQTLQIVDKHDIWVTEDQGRDELTLVTCWPFDALVPQGPDRLIVKAVPYRADQ